MAKLTRKAQNELLRKFAKAKWYDEGVIEVDDNAKVAHSEGGAYVQAWVWVANEDAGIETEEA